MGKPSRRPNRRDRQLRQTPRRFVLPEWKPDPDGRCPCGSGQSYSRCCQQLRGSVKWQEAADAWARDDVARAEVLFRGLLVQYLGWVYEHTVPVKGAPVYGQLARIDAAALRDISDSILTCMALQGKAQQIQPFLDAIGVTVPLGEFSDHLVYLRALSYHVYLDDAESARQELRKLPNATESSDSEVLELYIDVFRDSLSEVETLPIIDRILQRSRTRGVQLQYTMLRSLLYASLGDTAAAERVLLPIVDGLRRARPEPPHWDEIHMAARTFDHRYQLTADRTDYEEAVSYYRQIALEALKPYGQARLLRELGALQSKAGEHTEAVKSLQAALAIDPANEIKVTLVFALMAARRVDEAVAAFSTIDKTTLPSILHLEYWHAAGSIAVATANSSLVQDALAALRSLTFPGIYGARLRDHVVEELSKTGNQTSRIARLLSLTSTYVELKPNIFGIGVNLNRVLERLASAFEKH